MNKLDRWLRACRNHVRNDYDNVILYSGREGDGKSNTAFQIMHALDPSFNRANLSKRVFFTSDDFMANVGDVPAYGAILLDEALFRNRKGMHKNTVAFLDYLQICRGRNHHIGLCFPHAYRLDKAILDDRVRWNCHIPTRGVLHVRKREFVHLQGDDVIGQWSEPMIEAIIAKNTGGMWRDYLRMKDAHMRQFQPEGAVNVPTY